MEIFAQAFLFKKLGCILRVLDWAKLELLTEIRCWCCVRDAARAVLPRSVDVPFSSQDNVVAAGRPPFQKIESGEELHRLEIVADVCGKQIPCTLVFALLVKGNAFVRIVIIKVYVSVCVIRADLYTCIEKEFICKFTVGEKSYGHRIIVMRFCICEIRDRNGIHELYVDVQFF